MLLTFWYRAMQVLIVGSGKLATELLNELLLDASVTVRRWPNAPTAQDRSVVLHAGSGRELNDVIAYCRETKTKKKEQATKTKKEETSPTFPVILCPYTYFLLLKFL